MAAARTSLVQCPYGFSVIRSLIGNFDVALRWSGLRSRFVAAFVWWILSWLPILLHVLIIFRGAKRILQ